MVLRDPNLPSAEPRIPVLKCKLCQNWYALGAGKPKNEPCYQAHESVGRAHAHCHWHDKSLNQPPNANLRRDIAAMPAEWETALKVETVAARG